MTIGRAMLACAAAAALFAAGIVVGQNKFNKPASVVHVVTIKWKDGITDAEKKTAYDAVQKMAGQVDGIRNVWVKPLKVQGEGFTDAFVLEFRDRAAFDAYADAPGHKEFEKVYIPLRGRSTTHDITN